MAGGGNRAGRDDLLQRWAQASEAPAPAFAPPSRGGLGHVPILGLIAVVLLAVLLLRQASLAPVGTEPTSSPTPPTSAAEVATATPPESPATISPQVTASPSPSSLGGDASQALAAATAYESARAGGRWAEAWASLSADSHAQFGSLTAFERAQTAYNAAGGTTFTLATPSQDPDLLSPTYLGDVYTQVAAHADIARAWLVFANHPNVRGASAGSEGLLVAPVGGQWFIWVAH